MLRIAVVETEEIAKEIVFSLRLAYEEDFVFHYYNKLSQLNKDQQDREFQLLFFHGKFDTPRVNSAFIQDYQNRLTVFCDKGDASNNVFEHVMHIDRNRIRDEMPRVLRSIAHFMKIEQQYFFSYNNVSIALKMHEIYYIEKDNKNLIYHTKKGEFSERKSMRDAEVFFSQYPFVRIHSTYMVNLAHVIRIENDAVYLRNLQLPIARARKNDVMIRIKELTEGK